MAGTSSAAPFALAESSGRRSKISRAIVFVVPILLFVAVSLSDPAIAQQTMPTEKQMQERLNAMPPEKRAKLLDDLQRAMDQMNLPSDLQTGKCTRDAEVQIKAGQGEPDSIYALSEMYRQGWCVPKDLQLFHENLERAAKRGKGSASVDLGYYYETGTEGYAKALDVSAQWYEGAVKAGEPRAMIRLGRLLLEGKGVGKDTQRALQLFNRAADMDEQDIGSSNEGLRQLAFYYLSGDDSPPNVALSRTFGLRGAAQCDGASMAIVAMSFQMPPHPDLIQAYAWANAANQHSEDKALELAASVKKQLAEAIGASSLHAAEALTKKLPVCLPAEKRQSRKQ
jgi:TPR repeat protein